jgi:hypothetical protein
LDNLQPEHRGVKRKGGERREGGRRREEKEAYHYNRIGCANVIICSTELSGEKKRRKKRGEVSAEEKRKRQTTNRPPF